MNDVQIYLHGRNLGNDICLRPVRSAGVVLL